MLFKEKGIHALCVHSGADDVTHFVKGTEEIVGHSPAFYNQSSVFRIDGCLQNYESRTKRPPADVVNEFFSRNKRYAVEFPQSIGEREPLSGTNGVNEPGGEESRVLGRLVELAPIAFVRARRFNRQGCVAAARRAGGQYEYQASENSAGVHTRRNPSSRANHLIKANCGQAAPAVRQPIVPQKPFIKIIPAGLPGLQAVSRTQRFCRAPGTYYLYLRVKAAVQVQNHGAITLFKPERTVS
jgi:hypothetical protein